MSNKEIEEEELLKKISWEIQLEKSVTETPSTIANPKKTPKNVEYITEISSLSSLFSTMSFTTEVFIPRVAIDLIIVVKFLKLPIKAIPEGPKKTEIILEDSNPNTKLTPTETEFSERTLINALFLSLLITINFL